MLFGLRLTRSTGTEPLPGSAMTHIAIQEALDDKVVDWMEKVTDEEYRLGTQESRKKS